MMYWTGIIALLFFAFLPFGDSTSKWVVVFRGISGRHGGSNDIYNLWSSGRTRNDNNKNAQTIQRYSHGHYKSSDVENWSRYAFSKIKLSAYVGGRERAYFIFNSLGANKMTWLSHDRIIGSSYGRIGGSLNFCSIGGSSGKRRFFINRSYGGCNRDYGWFVISEKDWCNWDSRSTYPNIQFSPGNPSNRNDGIVADEMVIHAYEECPSIDHCSDANVRCLSRTDSKCEKCDDQGSNKENSLFWQINYDRVCQGTCSWKDNWCWPGRCSDNLKTSCICHQGFKPNTANSAKCDLDKKPSITVCKIGTEDRTGQVRNSTSHGACSVEQDEFIKFQSSKISVRFDMQISFNLPSNFPTYVHRDRTHFGIVEGQIVIYKHHAVGLTTLRNESSLSSSSWCSVAFSDRNPHSPSPVSCTANIPVTPLLNNGERLCVRFTAVAGGYLRTTNFERQVQDYHIYTRTQESNEVCFRYDNAAPEYCKENGVCDLSFSKSEPLIVSNRLTDTANITIEFNGWLDPVPPGGQQNQVSGITKYSITVHDVSESDSTSLKMNESPLFYVNATGTTASINLPREPALYAISIEVIDEANNFKKARRFVLYDSSSFIDINHAHIVRVTSGFKRTNYTWQIHHGKTCVNWHSRYYNTFQKGYNLLRRIQPDYHRFYTGIYEQNTGTLPVTGTPNVDGITNFTYTWTKSSDKHLTFAAVPNATNEHFCADLEPHDGDTIYINITSTDIMNRQLTEEISVNIDASVPDINSIGITRDGHNELFVHNSTDISKMKISFNALDMHSGLYAIEWRLGTLASGNDIGSGSLPVSEYNGSNCSSTQSCYCPKIGNCEKFKYEVGFNSIVTNNTHIGLHNREYYFTLIVTNKARLVNVERIDILVDSSPPVPGVVIEGAIGSSDVDFTSSNDVIVNWDAFIDHESGINSYVVGLSGHCQSISELKTSTQNHTYVKSVPVKTPTTSFRLEKRGLFITSVFAYNNAMEASEVSCSDGVWFDDTPPTLTKFELQHAKARDIVGCWNSTAYLIKENLKAISLPLTFKCKSLCNNSLSIDFLSILPLEATPYNDTEFADHICEHQIRFSPNWYLYIPNDRIAITWNVSDAESQLEGTQVGFSSDASNTLNPDIQDFSSISSSTRYSRLHEGLDRGVPFFIIMKATNKAGLETKYAVGPVIIDETPPIYTGGLEVIIRYDFIYVAWDKSSFKEFEQKEAIDKILFRVGHDQKIITPFHEGKVDNKCYQVNKSICFRFPLNRLQIQDAEDELLFYFEVYIYNFAGLYTIVKSDTFQVTSRFPPSRGIVLDINPEASDAVIDSDYQTVPDEACVRWKGFSHHKNVSYEIGLGSEPLTDNIVSIQHVIPSGLYCITGLRLRHMQKYFFVVIASCSGGDTPVSSNGFIFIDETAALKSYTLNNGIGLREADTLIEKGSIDTKMFGTIDILSNVVKRLSFPNDYTLKTNCSPYIDIQFKNVSISVNIKQRQQTVLTFVPLTAMPQIELTSRNISVNNTNCTYELLAGRMHSNYISDIRQYDANLEVQDQMLINMSTHYKVGLFESICQDNSTSTTFSCLKLVYPYQQFAKNSTFSLTGLRLSESHIYHGALSLCFQQICLTPKFTPSVFVQSPPTHGSLSATASIGECTSINISGSNFECTGQIVTRYQWSVFNDEQGHHQVVPWHPFVKTNNGDTFAIQTCFHLPVYPYQNIQACLQGFCASGVSTTVCKSFRYLTHSNAFKKNTIYELDTANPVITEIENMVYSENLGSELVLLHSNEVDFSKPSVKMVGAVVNGGGKTINWYLVKDNSVFPKTNCAETPSCIDYVQSDSGLGKFKQHQLQPNTKYFICAQLNDSVDSDLHLNDCGNGFVIENDPPVPGSVTILNQRNGFITSSNVLSIQWQGFKDIEEHVAIQYPTGIKKYTLEIGTHPFGRDVLRQNADLYTSFYKQNLTLKNGLSYFATVTAEDYVGLESSAISERITVDTTPPILGSLSVGGVMSDAFYVSSDYLDVHWDKFADPESGIASFKIGVGSTPNSTDIISLYEVDGTDTTINKEHMQDGHMYFVILSVMNNAGLSAVKASKGFLMDSTPPSGGVVKETDPDYQYDLDYQTDTRMLHGQWDHFIDDHSGILYYEVGVGSEPYHYDVEEPVHVGLKTEYSWKDQFYPGVKYYITVRACNKARLCTKISSDGIIMDNSPPIPGVVHVGLSDRHRSYIGHRSFLTAQWIGFQDPHSGLNHFDICVGTSSHICDILPRENVFLSSSVSKTGLSLQNNTDMYVTIRAFNRLNMSVERSSDKFRIDTSPPYPVRKPTFLTNNTGFSGKSGTQWDKSVLRLIWKFEDDESPLVSHSIELKINRNGKTIFDTMTCGSQTDYTIILDPSNFLRDGDTYRATISACNDAELCTTESTEDLLIDSTPPTIGGFKAINAHSPISGGSMNNLKWKNVRLADGSTVIEVFLEWYGFVDAESGIDEYFLTVSYSYSGSELSNGSISVTNKPNPCNVMLLNLTEKIESSKDIILSLWTVNGAGMRSNIGRVTTTLVAEDISQTHGFLLLKRHSCVSYYCNNDCTCAVVGMKCISSDLICQNDSMAVSSSKPVVNVYMGLGSNKWNMSMSSGCLSVFWDVITKESDIMRFEWSMGIEGGKPGEGVFNIPYESEWYDIGHGKNIVHCLNSKKYLQHGNRYVAYVKAWVSYDQYYIYRSTSVLIDTTPPSVRRGAFVKESLDNCLSDVEYTDDPNITVCWGKAFLESEGHIVKYDLMGGTSPYGNDLVKMTSTELRTTYKLNPHILHPGTTYFFTVVATNNLGLKSSLVSDGVLVDTDEPIPGVVYNTKHFRNRHYQNSATELAVSWQGFDDHHSYIKLYAVSLIDVSTNITLIQSYVNGMDTSVSLTNLHLRDTESYKVQVTATDAVGHSSPIAESPAITVDLTPPMMYDCLSFEEMSLSNKTLMASDQHEFVLQELHLIAQQWYKFKVEISSSVLSNEIEIKLGNDNVVLFLAENMDGSKVTEYNILQWNDQTVNVSLLLPDYNDNVDVSFSIFRCTHMVHGRDLTVRVKQIGSSAISICNFVFDEESGLKRTLIGAGTTKGGFQIRDLSVFSEKHHSIMFVNIPHGSPIYVTTVAENHAGLRFVFKSNVITMDHTPPSITDISTENSYRKVKSKECKKPSSVKVLKREDGNDTLIHHKAVGEILNQNHTHIANNATLQYIYSDSTENQTGNMSLPASSAMSCNEHTAVDIKIQWKSSDCESGIYTCWCSLGYVFGFSSAYDWTASEGTGVCHFSELHLDHGVRIYPTIRCTNNVQLTTTRTLPPIIISYEASNTSSAGIDMIPDSVMSLEHHSTIYKPTQSNMKHLTVHWAKLKDPSGIHHYEARITNEGKTIAPWTNTGRRTYKDFDTKFKGDAPYVVEVRGVNSGNVTSSAWNETVYFSDDAPVLTGTKGRMRLSNGEAYISWDGVFQKSPYGDLIFEVSVGTSSGTSGVLKPTTTNNESIDVKLTNDKTNELFITVVAVSPTGERTAYRDEIML